MDEVTNLFPEPEQEKNTLFPDPGTPPVAPSSELFRANVAERYSLKEGRDYAEVKAAVDNYGPQAAVYSAPTVTSGEEILKKAAAGQLSVSEFMNSYKTATQKDKDITDAGVSRDSVEQIYANTDLNTLPVDQKQALVAKIFQDAYHARIPEDKGMLGTAFDWLGMMGRNLTYGIYERGTGAGEAEAYSDYMRAMAAKDVNTLVQIANESAQRSADKGLLGNNTLLARMDLQAKMTGGQALGEKYNFAIDVATLIPFGSIAKIGKLGTTAKALPLTVDAVDTAATVSLKAGDDALRHALKTESPAAEIVRHTASADKRVAAPSVLSEVSPSKIPVNEYEELNNTQRIIASTNFSPIVTTQELEAGARAFAEDKARFVKSEYRNHKVIPRDLDNFDIEIQIGRGDGEAFKSERKAAQVAAKIGGTVVPVGTDQFIVQVTQALPTKGFTFATLPEELESGFIRNWMSPELTTAERHLTTLKVGTEKAGYIDTQIVKPFYKAMTKLGKFNGEKQTFHSIVDEFHESAFDKTPPVEVFAQKWYERTGQKAPDNVLDAYQKTADMADAAWLMDADGIKKYLDTVGVKVVNFKNGREYKVIPDDSTTVPGNVQVYDISTNQYKPAYEILKSGKPVYLMAEEQYVNGKLLEYVSGESLSVRSPTHHDALLNRAFGPRRTTSSYFVKQDKKAMSHSGNEVSVAPRIIFGGRSEKEARRALNEIQQVMKRIADETNINLYDKASAGQYLTKADLKGAIKSNIPALNEFIAKTISFDDSIETVEDFLRMMDETGLEFGDLEVVGAGQKVNQFLPTNRSISESTSYEELYRLQHNTYDRRFKTLKPQNFEDFRVDPVVSMQRDFSRGVNNMMTRTYLKRASEGLIKGAEKYITNFKNIEKAPLYQQIREAKIDTSTKIGQKFEQERQVILRNFADKSQFTQNWEYSMLKAQEFIFDITGSKLSVFDWLSNDPIVALRGFAFHLKLGLFAPDQLILQSSQALNIMAIAPKYGMQAAAGYSFMRIALLRGDESLARAVGKRFAKLSGMTEDEFVEQYNYIVKSGRFQIGKDIAEYGGAEDFSYGIIRKGLEAGTTFFREGERVPRLMAIHVAYKEFKSNPANALVDLNTKEGFAMMDAFITRRADVLTANMTSASAAVWQRGLPSLMFQWQSFLARNLEQLFFGRDLTVAERARLATAQLTYFGLTGVGLGWAVDAFITKNPEGIDPSTYTLIKHGTIDFLIGEATGVRTAYSTRLSIGQSAYDFMSSLKEETFLQVVSGPAPGFAIDVVGQTFKTLYSLASGKNYVTAFNADKAFKNISSYSKTSQALWALNTGQFVNKSGRVMVNDLSPEAAKLYWLGAPLQEVLATYTANDLIQAQRQLIKDTVAKYKELNTAAFELAEKGDAKGAQELHGQALDLLVGLNPSQTREVLRQTRPEVADGFTSSIIRLQKVGIPGFADQIRRMKEGEVQ